MPTTSAALLAITVLGALGACFSADDDGGDPCSSRSGVDPTRKLADLDAGELDRFCRWALGLVGGEGHQITCPDGVRDPGLVADCVASFDSLGAACPVTVATEEACVRAVCADPCDLSPAACQPLVSCVGN